MKARAIILREWKDGEYQALYPQTTPSQVVDPSTGRSMAELMQLDSSVFEAVMTLPTADIKIGKIYLIKTGVNGVYEQWIYNGEEWHSYGNVTLNDVLSWADEERNVDLNSIAIWNDDGCILAGNDNAGVVYPSTRFDYTDYIPVTPGSTVVFAGICAPQTDAGACFYNDADEVVYKIRANRETTGYEEVSVVVPDDATKVRFSKWNDTYDYGDFYANETITEGRLVELEKRVNELYSGVEVPETLDPPAFLEKNIIATISTYMVGYYEQNGVQFLLFSKDLGRTWISVENTFGNLTMCHIFSDGSVMFANSRKIYKTTDFSSFAEVPVTDIDGTTFSPDGENFFEFKNGDSWTIVDGKEIFVWGEYKLTNDDYARIFYTVDNGATVKCAFEFDASQIDGVTIPARHVHQVIFDKYDNCWWVITGDAEDENAILRGRYNFGTDTWVFERLAYGSLFKFGELRCTEHELVLSTDYTEPSQIADKGLLVCNKNALSEFRNYRYLYNLPSSWLTGNVAISHYIADKNGNQLLLPDYKGYGMFFWSKTGQNFRKISLTDNTFLLSGIIAGPNFNNDLYCTCRTSSESPISHMMRPWINLADYMRKNGAPDFMRESIV